MHRPCQGESAAARVRAFSASRRHPRPGGEVEKFASTYQTAQ
jgi:hypothetical protein